MALQVARPPDALPRHERRQRLGHQRADRDDVDALLARDRQVVDVEHAEVELPAGHELQRVGSGARAADRQPDAVRRVGMGPHRREQRCMDRVRREVERQLHTGRRAAAAACV
jgi:hypothetical protein